MNYEKIYDDIERRVGELKIQFGCKSWKSSCLSNDVVRKAKELKEELKHGCGDDCTQHRATATEPDFCGDVIICCACEDIISKIDALVGVSE